MDKIWYRNPSKSEVIGCCGGDEKTNDHGICKQCTPAGQCTRKTHMIKEICCLLSFQYNLMKHSWKGYKCRLKKSKLVPLKFKLVQGSSCLVALSKM